MLEVYKLNDNSGRGIDIGRLIWAARRNYLNVISCNSQDVFLLLQDASSKYTEAF